MLTRRTMLILVGCTVLAAAAVAYVLSAGRGSAQLRLAFQNRVASAIVIVAVEQEFFAEEGLPIKAYRFNSGPACSEALYSGSADIGTMGDTTALIATWRGAPLTIIASHGCGEHRHRIVVGANSDVRDVADLAGKSVGVKKGTSTYGGFLAFLAHHQITPEELQIIDIRPTDMPEALAAGSLDAFVASEPTPSLAELGGARELATLGGLGNKYPILILARDTVLAQEPEKVHRFLRALRHAEVFVQNHPERAAAIVARATGLPPEVARRAMQRHTYRLSLGQDILASLEQTAAFLTTQGIIRSSPDVRATTAPQYLRAAPAWEPDGL